jgi:hypothetical protein
MPCVSGRGSNGHDGVVFIIDDLLGPSGGFLVMLKVFLDRAEKRDDADGVSCVVATIFKPTRYKQFVRPWNRMLRRWDASAFHATDFYCGYGEFRRNTPQREQWFQKDSRQIPVLIGQNVAQILAVAFRPDEFISRAPEVWKEKFGTDTHAIAAQLCLVLNGRWLEERRPTERFAYVQEVDPNAGKIAEAVNRMRLKPDYAKVIRVSSFNTAAKGEARGVEASDFVGWHWNKHYMDRVSKGESLPRKDFAAFMNLTEGKVRTAFVTGDNLDLLFNTFGRAVGDKLWEKLGHANAKGQAAQ